MTDVFPGTMDAELLLRSAHAGKFFLNLNTQQLVWDARSCEIFGVERSALTGTLDDWLLRVVMQDLSVMQPILDHVFEEDELNMRFLIHCPDGEECHVWTVATVERDREGRPVALSGFHLDETQQHQRRAAASLSTEILAYMSECVWLFNATKRTLIFANPSLERELGYHPGEMEGLHIQDLMLGEPERLKALHDAVAQDLAKTDMWLGEIEVRHKDGSSRWFSASLWAFEYAHHGEVWGTLLQPLERPALRRGYVDTSSSMATIYDSIADSVFAVDMPSRCIDYANHAVHEMFGYDLDEVIGQRTELFYPRPEDYEAFGMRLRQAFVSGSPQMHVETQLARRDGTRFWASILTTFLVEGGSLSHVISVVRDISRQKELESQLLHAQKMEAIGTLAGGVAHDMNNILAAILSLGNVMQIKGGCKDANEIVQAAKRGKALVEQLLGFARKGRYDPRPIVMDDEVRGVMRILERSISKKISLETAFEAPRIQVEGDSLQLSQAVLNVCLNARDAITEHGQIRIASSVVHVSESKPVAGLDSGRYYRLTVVDDGHGMPPEVLLRVFDPFFSTKDVGSGTGLGLSMAYGVVQSHGGLIQIESQPNKGATVTFWFPTLEGEAMTDSRAEQSSGPAQKKKGSLRVMLVDDEWMIRESLTRLLEALGHSTLTAESGARAITSFREYYDTIDIVLLDISMPEMDGAECFTALREIDPEARIIVCSGHGGAGTVQKLLDAGALGFLRKPFDVQSLTRALDTFSAPR